LDGQLIAMAAEEIIESADEHAMEVLLGSTLCAVQLTRAGAPLRPFAKYLARRFAAITARVPDVEQRRSFYRTGLSMRGCEALLTEVDRLLGADESITEADRFEELRDQLLQAATNVPELVKSCDEQHVSPSLLPALATDWVRGVHIQQLRADHGVLLSKEDAMGFSAFVERVVVRDLPWIVSAGIEFIRLRRGDEWQPYRQLGVLPAMLKFGLPTVGACFAASIGIRRRETAHVVGQAFENHGGGPFAAFLSWLSALAPEDVAALGVGEDTPELVQRIAALAGNRDSLLLLARGEGSIQAMLRGLNHDRRWHHVLALNIPTEVVLERESDNLYDPNAILVRSVPGTPLGYVAREMARGVAPLLDSGCEAQAHLVSRSGNDPVRPGTAIIRIRLRALESASAKTQ
jgi:hypothetical protein